MNKEIVSALSELEKEKGIRKDVVLEAIKAALETGYKKNFSKATNFSIDIDEENGNTDCFRIRWFLKSLKTPIRKSLSMKQEKLTVSMSLAIS